MDIARKFHLHFTDLILETIKLQAATAEDIIERIPNRDAQIADDLFARKKNVVFVLGHRGNWELANLYASLCFKQEVIVAYKPLSNIHFDGWLYRIRTRFGSTMVPMKKVHSYLAEPRKKPYMVVLVNDQSPSPEKAYWTRFLNQDTGIFRGAEMISRQHDTALYYFDIVRNPLKRGFYEIQITEISEVPNLEANNSMLEQQIRILEKDIRLQPHNWLWTHRRWKHRKPDVLLADQVLQTDNRTIWEP